MLWLKKNFLITLILKALSIAFQLPNLLSVERDSRGHRVELRGVQADRGGPQGAGQGHRLNQAHGHANSFISE